MKVTSSQGLFRCHVESFNYFTSLGCDRILNSIDPEIISMSDCSEPLRIWLEDLKLESLATKVLRKGEQNANKSPRSCREAGETYKSPLSIEFCWQKSDGDIRRQTVQLGQFPIMVKSTTCTLAELSPVDLVAQGEEAYEAGGYFIINGIERMIRLIIQQRRHHILGLRRRAFLKRSPLFSEYATVMRCVAPNEQSSLIRLHYMRSGSVKVAFQYRRQEYFVPLCVILRALATCSDVEFYETLCAQLKVGSCTPESYIKERLTILQLECEELNIQTHVDALLYIGQHFRTIIESDSSESDILVGERILNEFICIHLNRSAEKLSLISLMMTKLFSMVTGNCIPDNPDSLVNQEVLLPGLLLQSILRERIQLMFQKVITRIKRSTNSWTDRQLAQLIVESASMDVGKTVEYFLATGNLSSPSGLGLSQTSGFTIVAEKLNYFRYLSHFRSVHRGAYFMELRTTTVRKLLPESWGFLCPVHTPDGSPCGLLNHLAEMCEIVTPSIDPQFNSNCLNAIISILERVLMRADQSDAGLPVVIEGMFVGYVSTHDAISVVGIMRTAKSASSSSVLAHVEIAHIHSCAKHGVFPGLYIFYGPSRLIRPVQQRISGRKEYIGTLEQAFASVDSEANSSARISSHVEFKRTSPLSCIASLTPWSDYNQSPRNMYQCQMAKQTMGTPMHTICYRSDTKLYRLHSPQRPLAMTQSYDKYCLDDYALGTNAVVAVLSYTGYDMEDAMIVNKSSLARGFAHATLYKTTAESLSKQETAGSIRHKQHNKSDESNLDVFGVANVGSVIYPGSAMLKVGGLTDSVKSRQISKHGTDPAIVDRVVFAQTPTTKNNRGCRAVITLRYNRNPVIGDKFSSRHGQKGVLSFLWAEEDMPFSNQSGIRPDIIINPHAFPSRMTIGMLVESLAAKASAMIGNFADATPFQHEDNFTSPSEKYGSILRNNGYSFCGNESLINGFTGEQFSVDIYIGVVYYQRLRHMVSDKFQVRSTGPNNPLTKQPIKGRKSGGGIRFGEMERDSLLAHGAAYLLRDRLNICSDNEDAWMCNACGSLIAPWSACKSSVQYDKFSLTKLSCRSCCSNVGLERISVPHVFIYLAAELAAMNISIELAVKS